MDQYNSKTKLTPQKMTPQPRPVAPVAAPVVAAPKKSPVTKIIVAVVLLIVLLAAAGAAYKFVYKKNGAGLVGVDKNNYQALFLTNGQVYFGKLEKADKGTIKISDIYYLQVQQAVQPREGENQQGETQLVKLGEELHGPEDEMFIDRGQVLFWENLKNNGKVVSAIKEYKQQ